MAELGSLGMSPKIFFLGKNPHIGLQAGDDTSLASSAASMGFEVLDDLSVTPDIAVTVDYTKREEMAVRQLQRAGAMQVLVKQEPYVVLPEHRERNPGSLFDLVLSRGIPDSDTLRYPNSWDKASDWTSHRSDKFVAITSNKWSAIPGQLYSLRNAVYSNSDLIDLYGHGWDRTRIKNLEILAKEVVLALRHRVWPTLPTKTDWASKPFRYLGPVEDKVDTMAGYDFSVVIENSGHYMSEKLMDSLLAGNLPVYVGASVESFGIPAEFVFQAEPTLDSVLDQMAKARKIDVFKHREKLREWLSRTEVEKDWRAIEVNRTLMERIIRSFEAYRSRGT